MGCTYPAGDERPPLIGRDAELRQLIAVIETMTPGRAAVLVIEGPPGSGRQRLADEFLTVSRQHGLTVVPEPEWIADLGVVVGHESRITPETRGVLFVCGHPHRVDPRGWAALEMLAESVPVMVLMTARTGTDPLPSAHLAAPEVTRIRLAPLSPGDVERLATRLLGGEPSAELLDLSRVAAGRPGAVRDLIIGLREEGLIAGRMELRSVRLPGRTRSCLVDQLAGLSPQARHLLLAATTLRSPFPLLRLTRMLRVKPVLLLPAIEEVLESGLLTGDGEMLRFSHELVRSVVEDSMPRPVVAALRGGNPAPVRRAPVRDPGELRRAADWALLTAREQEVADFVGRALTNVQIAGRLGRSPHTVNFHLRQIFQKLGITSRVELASLLRQRETAGVTEPGSSGPSSS